MNENVNIPEELLDKPIYRIVDFDRFAEILTTGCNTLVRTFLWNDPFENILIHPDFTKIRGFSIASNKYYTYAQCWSFSEENDLLWRTYSQNSDGIRIRSTARKLLNSLINSETVLQIITSKKLIDVFQNPGEEDVCFYEEIDCFIGKVHYLDVNEMKNFIKENITDRNHELYIKSLLIKREPFRNEEEVRIGVFYFDQIHDEILRLTGDIFRYKIDFNDVFEEVVFDPRISDFKFKGLRGVLIDLKFDKPIFKSGIYDKPNIAELMQ